MEQFPFSKTEWKAVENATLPVVNAGLADDPVLGASYLVDLLDVLDRLDSRYGEHPVLLETRADFIEDEEERIALYRRAVGLAKRHELQTLTTRIALARVLLDRGSAADALVELRACEPELGSGDDTDRKRWDELVLEASSDEQNGAN